MSNPVVDTLVAHLRWADVRIVEALRRPAEVPAAALELFAHVVAAEHVWLSRLNARDAAVAVWPSLTIDECAALANANADELVALVRGASGGAFERVVSYRNSAGVAFESTVEEIVVHVAMHGQYHRGQVNLFLRQAGSDPAPVDYIAFTRGAPAATRQPR